MRLVSRSAQTAVRGDTIGGTVPDGVHSDGDESSGMTGTTVSGRRDGIVTGHDAPTAGDAVSGDAEGDGRNDS